MRESRPKAESLFWLRFSLAAALLVACGIFLEFRPAGEHPRAHLPLQSFPIHILGWRGSTVPIASDIRAVLGPGEFLERLYRRDGAALPVDLFVAYFPTQRAGDNVHSPKNCLPGGGWVPIASSHLSLAGPTGKPFNVNRYLIARGLDRMLVLYWFEEQGHSVASEYWAKAYLMADAFRENRTDGALIRVAVPVLAGETVAKAEQKAVGFTKDILPLLPAYVPD